MVREVFIQGTDVSPSAVIQPSATFTPTVAGLHLVEGQSSSLPQEMCNLIAQTVARSINSALFQRGILAPSSALAPALHSSKSSSHLSHEATAAAHSPSHSHHSDQSFLDEEEAFDYCLSGDEEDPITSHSTGLFCHEMFEILLHKAKITANMGLVQPTPLGTLKPGDSNTHLFTE